MLNESIPEEMDDLLNNMQRIRNGLKGDFTEKVKQLDAITSVLTTNRSKKSVFRTFLYVISYIIAILFLMIAGYYILSAFL